jgi:cellulose 1,4-beta-cellobiosidase
MSNVKRLSIVILVLLIAVASVLAVKNVSAATVCSPATAITVPFAKDGVGDVCLQATSLCTYINSWNATTIEVNGTAYTNLYTAASSIAPLNGGYTIHYVSTVAWGHFEIGGTCGVANPTATPITPAAATKTNTPVTPVGNTPTRTRTATAGTPSTVTRTPTTGLTATKTNTPVTPVITATKTNTPVTPVKTPTTGPTTPPGTHLANPFVGAKLYVNHDWNGSATYAVNTFLWLDSIDAVNGTNGYTHSLAGHLDLALAQGANAVSIVIYDLPNRDCSALASNGELLIASGGTARYRAEYIDVIYSVISQAKYAGLRIIAVIEPDSLPNLVTNLSFAKCTEALSTTDGYAVNTQYTLNKLSPLSNFYSYIDIGHAGWMGWDTNFTPGATLIGNMILGTTKGGKSVDGFISNTANTSVTVETYLDANTTVGGNPVRSSTFYQWNVYIDESHYDAAWKTAMAAKGINAGMLIDTSRNGWGGCGGGQYALQTCRPTATSTSTVLETYVNTSRIDRRPGKGDWCNQDGAGIGALPAANPGNGYDAYVWVKPPGESDGSSSLIANTQGKGFDRMCDPTYGGNALNNNVMTNALPNAPLSGAWFAAQFTQLVANKFP